MADIQLIGFDLDNTTLTADHETFSPALRSAFTKAQEKGIWCIPVTGRQRALLPKGLQTGETWQTYLIGCDGAEIWDLRTRSLIDQRPVQHEKIRKLIAYCRENQLPLELSANGVNYLTPEILKLEKEDSRGDYLKRHIEEVLPKIGNYVDSFDALLKQPDFNVTKINLFCTDADKIHGAYDFLTASGMKGVYADPYHIEITEGGVSKGTGLIRLCNMLHVPVEHTMAMGDSGNDLPLLKTAGFSVAMGNAEEVVKQCCDAVTDRYDEDGAAKAVIKYALEAL